MLFIPREARVRGPKEERTLRTMGSKSVALGLSAFFVASTTLCFTVFYNPTSVKALFGKPIVRKAVKVKKKKKKKKSERIPVGVGVVAYDQETRKIIVGLRRGAQGAGTWALPGGWLEKGESLEGCALREMCEETGLTATSFEKCQGEQT